jgi:hypothetical protein
VARGILHNGISLRFVISVVQNPAGHRHNIDVKAPDDVGIWKVDLKTGDSKLIISIAQGRRFRITTDR